MPTLDELDTLCTYLDDQKMFVDCIYKHCSIKIKPRALRPSPVIWIVKDGKPVDYRKEG